MCAASPVLLARRSYFDDGATNAPPEDRRTTPMTMLPSHARMALFPTPSMDSFLSRMFEETTGDATLAFQSDYARRSGYAVGPNGEWITEVRPVIAK